jgi:3-methyladenine DNA glycosylase AlkD
MEKNNKTVGDIVNKLREYSVPAVKESMARFGIKTEVALGVSIPDLRKIAKVTGKDHKLAVGLWKTGIHEARILAGMIDDPDLVTRQQMEAWVKDFDSWDLCDQCCSNLFDKTEFGFQKAVEWCGRNKEFVKRAGFALMATLAVHDKKGKDGQFLTLLPLIEKASNDDRNFVRKAVNWALRQIGKRNLNLNQRAIETAKNIQKMDSKSARWISSDALRELMSEAVQKRVRRHMSF